MALEIYIRRYPAQERNLMYYPIQVPYILNSNFSKHISYSEEVVPSLQNFVMCVWEMQPRSTERTSVTNVIVADGCIDLVVDYTNRQIGFAGMSKTNFHFTIELPTKFLGVRLKPGAFEQLTGLPAKKAMDTFLPLEGIDPNFDANDFFSLSFEQTKEHLNAYLHKFTGDKIPNSFVNLFDSLSKNPPSTTAELYQRLHFSPRQSQRLFMKHFGIPPQMALSILRFQYCLDVLTSGRAMPSDILGLATYYDQSHFIKDFKRNIGLTPFEYLRKYKE